MKRIFGPELLSNVSSEIESLLLREEKKIRQRMDKKKSKMSQKHSFIGSFFDINRSRKNSAYHGNNKKYSVNPIITILFVGMAMKTWKRFAQRKINGELGSNDSLPYVEEEEEDESNESSQSLISESESFSEDSLSSQSMEKRKTRRNASKRMGIDNDNEESSQSDDDSSNSSDSSLSIDDEELVRRNRMRKGRNSNQNKINLIKGFLWNKVDGKTDGFRSSNMFVNFFSLHGANSFKKISQSQQFFAEENKKSQVLSISNSKIKDQKTPIEN